MHVMRDCQVAKEIWEEMHANIQPNFYTANQRDWMVLNLKEERKIGNIPWKIAFGVTCWLSWKFRNLRIFDSSRHMLQSRKVWAFASEIVEAKCSLGEQQEKERVNRRQKWSKPERGWVKVNTDEVSKGSPGRAGCGGVIRDSEGKWVMGFAEEVGWCTAYKAEYWGARLGLIAAWGWDIEELCWR